MTKKKFTGDKKFGTSLLHSTELPLKQWGARTLPQWIGTHHLTYMTLLWSLGNFYTGWLAQKDLVYLWVVCIMIALQYLTDLWDGEVGRQRNAGLIKWGFYMDHFLDFIFLCSIVFVGYMISPPGLELWYFGLLIITGSFMVNSFLSFAATHKFQISYYGIGPTETRILFIIINIYIILAGTEFFWFLVPGTFFISLLGLLFNTYQIQKMLWDEDKKILNQQANK